MGFFSRLFGTARTPHGLRVTPEHLGHALFERAIKRLQDHHAQLEAMGAFARTPDLARSRDYMIGFIVFTVAPLDQVLTDFPIPEVRAARHTVRSAVLEKLKAKDAAEAHRLLDAQLSTYATAARTRQLSSIGHLAAGATGIPITPDVQRFLVSCYTSGLNFWLDALSDFGIDTS